MLMLFVVVVVIAAVVDNEKLSKVDVCDILLLLLFMRHFIN